MTNWQSDKVSVDPPSYDTTAFEDVVLAFDTTPLLVDGGAPSEPVSHLHKVNFTTFETMQDAPALGSGNTITQRIRGLTAGVTYELHVTFITNGNRRDMKLILVCVK